MKPVVLVSIEGCWDPLIALIQHQGAAGYVRQKHMGLLQVVDSVEGVFDVVAKAPKPKIKGLSWLG